MCPGCGPPSGRPQAFCRITNCVHSGTSSIPLPTNASPISMETAGHLTAPVQTWSLIEWNMLPIQLGDTQKMGMQRDVGFSLRLLADMFSFT